MIGFIKGQIIGFYDNITIINVNGIGYEIVIKNKDINLLNENNEISFHVAHIIREDSSTLYGFLTFEEKMWFLEFIKLNGLGPKVAIAILNSTDYKIIGSAILTLDSAFFSAVSGIGAKIANRIVNEMQKSVQKVKEITLSFSNFSNNDIHNINHTTINNQLFDDNQIITKQSKNNLDVKILHEATNVLSNLGFHNSDISSTIHEIIKTNKENNSIKKITTEFLVKEFLQKKKY